MDPRTITIDDVEALELSEVRGGAETRETRLRERVETFVDWAVDRERYVLDDSVTSAHLLLIAAEHLESLRELDRALDLAERAAASDDVAPFEATPTLVSIRLARGETAAAVSLADELRRGGTDDALLVEQVAEAFEHAGELAAAERWNVIGLRLLERLGDADAYQRSSFLSGRYRSRRDAGRPIDVLDTETERLRASLGQEPIGS